MRKILVVCGLAAAIGAGVLLFISGASGSSDGSAQAATGSQPIALPAALAGYRDIVQAVAAKTRNATIIDQQRAEQSVVNAATVAAYRRAFGGAPAAYRQYADSGLLRLPWVIAVRAPAPGLTLGPVADLKALGLAVPPRQVVSVGPVSCEVDWIPVAAGRKPDPADESAVQCQRSGSGVTVFVGGGGFTGPAGLDAMVAITNAGWSAVSG